MFSLFSLHDLINVSEVIHFKFAEKGADRNERNAALTACLGAFVLIVFVLRGFFFLLH